MENGKGIKIPQIDVTLVSKQVQAEIKQQLTALYRGARIEKIDTEPQAQNALVALKGVKAVGDLLEKTRKELVGPFNEQVKEINGYFKEIMVGIDNTEQTFKKALAAYQAAEEQKRLEAQRKADQDAERQRQKDLDDANALARESQEKAAEAQAAEIAGDHDRAAALLQEAKDKEAEAVNTINAPVTVAPVVQEAQKLAGFSTRKVYTAEVNNTLAFFKWAAKNEEWGLLEVNQEALNKLAAAKGEYFKAEGCRLVCREVASVRK